MLLNSHVKLNGDGPFCADVFLCPGVIEMPGID